MLSIVLRIVGICVLTALAQSYLPWWSCAIVAFAVEFFLSKGQRFGFFTGFYGVAIAWMVMAFYIDRTTDSVLTYRILELFSLPRVATVLVIVTGFVGGMVGGMASLAGNWTKAAFVNAD